MRRAAAVLLALVAACSGGDGDAADGATTTTAPPIDAPRLEAARAYAFAEGRNTQGVVILHHGELIAEWYAEGASGESFAASWSMAKSFTSALIGIAIEQGLIPGVDEPMSTWFPEWANDERSAITLEHVLHMASGLDWVEDDDPASLATSDIAGLVLNSPDELAYAVGQPLRAEPGTVFNYSSGDTMLLSGVLQQATGRSAADYAEEVLFDPIGMDPVDWWQDAAGHTLTYCCLDTTSRDFARFGQLYLEGGRWGDEQVVPADWVAESLTPSPIAAGYGYQWWLTPGTTEFQAIGFDGQHLYVLPEHDLVVVRNGTYGKYDGPSIADPNLFTNYPSAGLSPGRGTAPPNDWDDTAFLTPIVEALG
jgi:CubicO group peptidase (beta-lactamase class C family)